MVYLELRITLKLLWQIFSFFFWYWSANAYQLHRYWLARKCAAVLFQDSELSANDDSETVYKSRRWRLKLPHRQTMVVSTCANGAAWIASVPHINVIQTLLIPPSTPIFTNHIPIHNTTTRYIYIYIYIYVIYIYICMNICHIYIYVSIYLCVCVYVCVCTYIHIHIYIYIYIHAFIHLFIYLFIYL